MLTRTAFPPMKLRVVKCKQCREPFQKRTLMHTSCSAPCVLLFAEARAVKAELQRATAQARAEKEAKRDLAARNLAIKTRSEWMREAQAIVNRYVRLRDHALPCVSCDRPAAWGGQWHASHFRSVGACTTLRFHLWNIHKACSICNNWKSGNLSEYEPRLRERIGGERVDWLRAQNERVVYSVDHLRRLKAVFAKKVKRLERRIDRGPCSRTG